MASPSRSTSTATPTEPPQTEGLSLYGYPSCPYCARVLGAIRELGLEIPLRNTMQDDEARSALLEARGRGTVPVLRIEEPSGEVRWMPESADIVRYLVERFGTVA